MLAKSNKRRRKYKILCFKMNLRQYRHMAPVLIYTINF